MKKELLCPKCGEKLRDNVEKKQMVTGGLCRFVYGKMRNDVDAQKLQCDGCDINFHARGEAVCFSTWERGEATEQWERNYILEMEAVQL